MRMMRLEKVFEDELRHQASHFGDWHLGQLFGA